MANMRQVNVAQRKVVNVVGVRYLEITRTSVVDSSWMRDRHMEKNEVGRGVSEKLVSCSSKFSVILLMKSDRIRRTILSWKQMERPRQVYKVTYDRLLTVPEDALLWIHVTRHDGVIRPETSVENLRQNAAIRVVPPRDRSAIACIKRILKDRFARIESLPHSRRPVVHLKRPPGSSRTHAIVSISRH